MNPAEMLRLTPTLLWVLLLALTLFVLALGAVAGVAGLVVRRRLAAPESVPGPRPRATRWLITGLVVDGLVLAVAAVGLATAPSSHVPVPSARASAQDVVAAYLDASNAHDVGTMNAILDPARMGTLSRFRATWVVDEVDMQPVEAYHELDSVLPAGTEVVRVPVDLVVIRGTDLTVPDHTRLPWGFVLARPDAQHRWRIVDQGF
ncbi:hypothetical protein [Phycicoccus sp. Soil748]|uniref:hypothetical protein n=1 Tax=Phycicoccus sp. Soil748 TaxID=1736397 RepID=UPI00070344AC|nr:hypothetical protein [Phycicoccus sp. Soil748]KRE54523.1 hypothetical protein ASG70_10095 [Phycicoccus sp. Soil748]